MLPAGGVACQLAPKAYPVYNRTNEIGPEARRLSMEETYEDIKKIIVDLLGAEESKVTREARFREDLEADSLDLVELIMAFEEQFGGRFPTKMRRRSLRSAKL